jgi:hypothetical protein
LTLAAIALFGATYLISGAPSLIEEDGRTFVFHHPPHSAFGVLLLTQQLGYFNILPMYIVMLLWSPAVLAMNRLSRILAVSVSFALYVAARFGLTLPN